MLNYQRVAPGSRYLIHMRIMRFYHILLLVHHSLSIKLQFWSYAALSTHLKWYGGSISPLYPQYIPLYPQYIPTILRWPLWFFLFVLILSICDCFAWWHGLLRTPGVKTEDKSCPSYFWQPLKCPPNICINIYIYACYISPLHPYCIWRFPWNGGTPKSSILDWDCPL